MSTPNYRVVLSFDADRKVFSARAPELEHCSAEGATRGEAIARLEKEIEAQLQNMQERGHRAPAPIDEIQWTGEMTIKVSRTLHRDLAWQARAEGVELPQLISELLSAGLDGRRQVSRQPGSHRGRQPGEDNQGNQRDRSEDRGGRGGGYGGSGGSGGSRYHGIMDDRANFIEYVRGLENEAPRGPGAGRGPRPGPGARDDSRGGGPGGGGGPGARRGRGRRGHVPGGPGGGDGGGPREQRGPQGSGAPGSPGPGPQGPRSAEPSGGTGRGGPGGDGGGGPGGGGGTGGSEGG